MRMFGGSTSVRLTLGFVTIMCVFGAALLTSLYNLKKAEKASEETRARQETRRDALKVGGLAQQLFFCQQSFVEAKGIDSAMLMQFESTYSEMEETLESVRARPVDEMERTYLEELAGQCRRLHDIFHNTIHPTKYLVLDGVEPQERLLEAHRETRNVLTRINELNDSLGHSFESKVHAAEIEASRARETSLTTSKAALAFALVVSALVIYYTRRAIVGPVNKLIEGTKTLASGDMSGRIEVGGAGEFRELAESFNRMTEALRVNQRQLVESEKMAGIGRLAAGVAHEINNPIAVILGYGRMLLARLPDDASPQQRAGLESIEEEALQCKRIVEGLLDLSRPSTGGEGEVINPRELVSEVLNLAQVLQLTQKVRIEQDVVDGPLSLTIGRSRLRQVVLNIVHNALEELQKVEGAELSIQGYVANGPASGGDETIVNLPAAAAGEEAPPGPRADRNYVVFRFSDNGPGIRREDIARIFEPFFTTKSTGTGLGLAITYNIVRGHQGTIGVESEPGKGTTFTVSLPFAKGEPAS